MLQWIAVVVSIAAATAARWLLDPLLGIRLPYVTYFVAVYFIAAYTGLWPSIVTLFLGWWVADFFFIAPRYGWLPYGEGAPYYAGVAMYFMVGGTSIVICQAMRHAQRLAAEQTERLRTTLASIGDAVITTDTAGRISNLNPVAETLTGWTNAESAGQPLDVVFHIVNEQTRKPVENPAAKALAEGVIVGLANHTVLIAKDGTERAIDDSAAPIRCKEGEVVGCVLVFRDISERRRAERKLRESEARKTAMFETTLDAIISIDHEGMITEFNASAERTFGHRREEVLGRELAEVIIPPAYRELHRQGLARYLVTGEGPVINQRLELAALRSDGSEFPVELTVTRIPMDGPPIFTAYLRDITERRRADEALSRLAAIVTYSEDAIISKDLAGVITSWNKGAEQLFGYSPGEAIGKPVTMLIPADHIDEEPKILERIRRGEVVDHYETVRKHKDGTRLDISLTVSPLKDAEGRIIGASKIARNMTERNRIDQQIRESGERFRTLADNMSQFAWMADATGWIYWYNQRWYDYTGTTLEEMQGWGWKQVHHPDHVDRVVERFTQHVREGKEWEDTFPLRGKDGNYRWFLSRARPIHDQEGKVVRWFGTNTDVTEQRQMAEALRQNAADMSAANRRKNEFLAMLAHELRNPLAPIRNALQIVQHSKGDGESVQSASEMMERQIGQLVRLVDDLLDVSRISRGTIELRRERVELASVIEQAVETCRPAIDSAKHKLMVTLPPQPVFLDADPVRLSQVFSNLLNNACKYSEPTGRIWLSAERQGSDVVVTVKDTGVGIASDMLPHIFEMFTQIDRSLERSQGGLGIGLTLVQRLAEMHGGSVSAHSDGVGHGSEFAVRLPILIDTATFSQDKPAADESAKLAGRRILVVDDNRDSAQSLAMLLKLTGNQTHTAYDGLAAVEAAAKFRPEVVLLDIGLPKLNGYETARKIREHAWGKSLVLVALTGWGQEEDRRKSSEAGFDGHLVKPVDHRELKTLLAELLKTSV
jgi:PAS domain S-box-containing protein